jgi:hypothetical protein
MLTSLLLGLYPRAWRERYGDEFAALLEGMGLTPGVVVDVLSGALDAHIRRRASDRAAARAQEALVIGGKITMGTALGIALAVVAWAIAVVIEGGDLSSYLLPSPLVLVVGGALAALLIGYGASGVAALPGLFGLAVRGPASASGASSRAIASRYSVGYQMFRDTGNFALLSGVIATLLGVIMALASLGDRPGQMGHALAFSLLGLLYGIVVAIFCYALSSNLRHKREQVDGTLHALADAAEHDRQRPGARVQDRLVAAQAAG